MIVLDTNVLSELMRLEPAPRVLAWLDAQPAESLATTATTVAELLHGAARLPDGARRDQLATAIDALVEEDFSGRILSFDVSAARNYAVLVADRERQGRPISVADGQIAAICRSRDAALATRNVRDFASTGLAVIDPWTIRADAPPRSGR